MVIGSLVTNIVADLSKWGPNLQKGRGQLASFVQGVNAFKTVITGAFAAVGVSVIKSSLDQAGALRDSAEALNLNVEQLQRLRYAADQLGSSGRVLDVGLKRFVRLIGEANSGSSKARESLNKLGLEFHNLAQSGTQSALLQAIDAIRNSPLAQQAARAQELFGRQGAALLPFIRAGSGEVRKVMESLYGVGILTEKQAKLMDDYNDKWEKWARILGTIKDKALFQVVEAIDLASYGGFRPNPNRLPTNFPTTPALTGIPTNFSRRPAMTGPIPGIRSNAPDIVVFKQMQDAQMGINRIVASLPGVLQLAASRALGRAPSLGPAEGLFKGLGGLFAGIAGAPGAVAGGLAGLARRGERVGPLEALSLNSREGRLALTENLRPRQNAPEEKTAKAAEMSVTIQERMEGFLSTIAKTVTEGGGAFDF